jgi:hypothetical protein
MKTALGAGRRGNDELLHQSSIDFLQIGVGQLARERQAVDGDLLHGEHVIALRNGRTLLDERPRFGVEWNEIAVARYWVE